MHGRANISVLALTALLFGCGRTIAVFPVLQHNQCQGIEAGLTAVSYEELAEIRGSNLIGRTTPKTEADESVALIAVSRGKRTTAGFSLSLAAEAELSDSRLTIPVTWSEPAPDALVPQMLTHPCIVIGVPAADYTEIHVIDQHGNALGALRVPLRVRESGQ